MPVDEIVPAREKFSYAEKVSTKLAQKPQSDSTPTQPDGSPKGGMDGNIVSNRDTGGAG